jgi:hypothetical protein
MPAGNEVSARFTDAPGAENGIRWRKVSRLPQCGAEVQRYQLANVV